MKRTLLCVGALVAGGATGNALPRHPGAGDAPPTPLALAPADRGARTCRGGQAGALQVELRPERVLSVGRGEAMDVSLRLASRFRGAARVRWGVELIDDRGRAFQSPSISPVTAWKGTGDETWARVHVPDTLPDGFYAVRITAVARGDGDDTAQLAHLYLRREHGSLRQLSPEEWLATSRENEAVEP